MQRFEKSGSGASVSVSDLTVTEVQNPGSLIADLGSGTIAPQHGFEYVRLGNTNSSLSSSRQGGVYLTADDSNAPFIDIFDNITSHADWNANTGSATTSNSSPGTKVRMGKLSGVTSAQFGSLATKGYGIWASGSDYLEGGINATEGLIAGWAINDATLTGGSVTLDKSGIIRLSLIHI